MTDVANSGGSLVMTWVQLRAVRSLTWLVVWVVTGGSVCSLAAAAAPPFRPAILFNGEVLEDQGFNAQMVRGTRRFEDRYGVAVTPFTEVEPVAHRQRLRQLAEAGYTPILVPSSSTAESVRRVAADFPDTVFITLDYTLDRPNVRSVAFREAEVAFLAGVAAARRSDSGHLGFLGGVANEALEEFRRGFEAGARTVRDDVQVTVRYLADVTARPWSDHAAARRLVAAMVADGADVVFPVAGDSSLGALAEAERLGVLAIGVDSDQNPLFPDSVLTSATKRLDQAVYVSLINERYRLWLSHQKNLGLAQGGMALVLDGGSRRLLGEALVAELQDYQREIVLGARNPLTGERDEALWQALASTRGRPAEITVALPTEAFFPLLLGNGPALHQPHPGLLVDALELLAERAGVTIHYRRQPRKRGLMSLQQGRVDGVISSTALDDVRSQGHLPGGTGRLDSARAVLSWRWGLYRLKGDHEDHPWPRSAVVPTASSVGQRLRRHGVRVYENPSLQGRFEMLLRGRVQAVAADRLYAEHLLAVTPRFRERIEPLPAALGRGYSYLVFSDDFYERYPEFCELLWNQLSEIQQSAELWDRVPEYLDSL